METSEQIPSFPNTMTSGHSLPDEIAGLSRENTACHYCGISYLTYRHFSILQQKLYRACELLKQVDPDLLSLLTDQECAIQKIPNEAQTKIIALKQSFHEFRRQVHSNFTAFQKTLSLQAYLVKSACEQYFRHVDMARDEAQFRFYQEELRRAEEQRATAESFKTMLDQANVELALARDILRSTAHEAEQRRQELEQLRRDNTMLQQAMVRTQVVTFDHERLRLQVAELTKKAAEDQEAIQRLREEVERSRSTNGSGERKLAIEVDEAVAECPAEQCLSVADKWKEIKNMTQKFHENQMEITERIFTMFSVISQRITDLSLRVHKAKQSVLLAKQLATTIQRHTKKKRESVKSSLNIFRMKQPRKIRGRLCEKNKSTVSCK
ncbi:uncharacterized protein LOC129589012 isoform X2 [Paramacrobiotus metropolitanus]|uniref:uncharacterized protein LOC129589012 isoform X2 n=1 Tax=Paramacrobiotus metropolitanus TaxID=2943436 RepID=UPI002445D4F1|nr:uncharacterized protein LOC129589012 isoform X2 [Paramacrobiotus metropolitanus]